MLDKQLNETIPVFARLRKIERLRIPENVFRVLLFFALAMAAEIGISMVLGLVLIVVFACFEINITEGVTGDVFSLLLSNVVSILVSLIVCTRIERRTLRTMGVTTKHMLRHYALGLLLGVGMMASTVLLAQVFGGVTYQGLGGISGLSLIALMVAWVVQGFAEEFMFRGYLMMSLGAHGTPWQAVLLSGFMFAAAHLGNDGISLFAVVNLTLYGVLMALIMLRTDSIWVVAALHSAWNCAQGNLFGLSVSGSEVGATVLRYDMVDGKALINGGGFGLEGGAMTTLVLLIAFAVVWLLPKKQTVASDMPAEYTE